MLQGAEDQHGGVVHQYIDASEAFYRLVHQLLPTSLVADIQAAKAGGVAQFTGQGLALGFQQVGDDHLRAVLDEQSAGLCAHAAGSAGDNGDFVC
ncbi:hypothetical protein D3C87_1862070 [compost metagenome]